MSSALEIFDNFQTLGICACLVFTVPTACFVYSKLLFCRPFLENYTFKLIVMNGIAELLGCVAYLFVYQLTSYSFMADFYSMLEMTGLVTPLTVMCVFLAALSLHTSLFIAFNRLKTIMYIRRHSNDSKFFVVSIILSVIFALPSALDFALFTTVSYVPIIVDNSTIIIPSNELSNEIFRTVSDIIRFLISLATLMVNIILCVLVTRERPFLDLSERRKFNGERGLVITSIVSYSFYMLYFANMILARYFDILFCGFAQWLFLGLNAITPFWSLLLFAPSVRRLIHNKRKERAAAIILRQTVSALYKPLGLVANKSGKGNTNE